MSTQYSATQQVNFAKNSDPAQGISLCISRVFNNISHYRIKKHIIEANLGFVERVDVIPVAGGKFKRAFVHFAPNKWNMRDASSRDALKALQEGKKIKIEYESPWYWVVGISGAERPKEAPKRQTTTLPISTMSGETKSESTVSSNTDATRKVEREKKAAAAEKRLTKKQDAGRKSRKRRKRTRRRRKRKKSRRKKRRNMRRKFSKRRY